MEKLFDRKDPAGRPGQHIGAQKTLKRCDAGLDVQIAQHAYGNHIMKRLHDLGTLRAKLKIGQLNDIYEQEADRVAEQVMQMTEHAVQPKPT